jgi:hypothetical protein
VDARKAALFKEVLEKVAPGSEVVAVEDDAELDLTGEIEVEGEADVEAEEPRVEAVEEVVEAPTPKRGRGRPKK